MSPLASGRLLKFISRAEHLAWRARWRTGRWCKLSWTPEERSAILRQDEAYRQADAKWQLNHGPVPGGAAVLVFQAEAFTDGRVSLLSNCAAEGADGGG